jgi:hypothetical protein
MSDKAVGILWEKHAVTGGTIHGYVTTKRGGKVRLFSLTSSSVPGQRFVLRSTLPGFNSRKGRTAVSEQSAKAMAALMLQHYVDILTGEDQAS